MRISLLALIAFLGATLNSLGQEFIEVDYIQINERLENYDSLLTKFKNGQSLPVDDYRALYYGYTFQEAYDPYQQNPIEQEISDLMAQGLSDQTTGPLIEKSLLLLDQSPFHLKYNYYLRNFIKNSTDDQSKLDQDLQVQYKGILSAILSSGDGLSKETAYVVNYPSDEYMVLRYLNLKPEGSSFETTYDIFEVSDENAKTKTVYFDVTRMAQIGTGQMGIETLVVEDEEVPEDAVAIGSRDELMTFVPAGMKTLAEVEGDFDQDGDIDWLLVLKKAGEEVISDAANDAQEPRLLVLIERDDSGLLQQAYTNANAVPCVDCGGGAEDPFVYITFVNDELVLKTQGGDLFLWERVSTFQFDQDDFKLVKDVYTSYRKGKKEQATKDVEGPDQFGEVYLKDFTFE